MTKFKRFAVCIVAFMMLVSACATLAACKKKVDNESTRLVLSSSELDGVFNPFFSSSGPDNTIIGMTQLSMISADKNGKLSYGEDEVCVVLDYEETTTGSGKDRKTTYKFVLKNDVKFSNGSPLTMRDVLFNMYVYLDPSYTGSSTMYSTDIVGLADYRTQTKNASEQENFEATYETLAWDRIEFLADRLLEAYGEQEGGVATDAQVEVYLTGVVADYKDLADNESDPDQKIEFEKHTTVLEDYKKVKELFLQELKDDYRLSKGTAEDIKFDEDRVHLTTDTEAFLYNEGFITWNEGKNGEKKGLDYKLGENSKNLSEEDTINAVYNSYVKDQSKNTGMYAVVLGSGSTETLVAEFTALEKKAYFDKLGDSDRIVSIEGITFANLKSSVTVNGKTYAKAEHNADGSLKNDTNEVLQIVINDVDPKAIWNFGFAVAPMYYYSNAEQIAAFDYETHFGVKFGDPDFMSKVVKATEKTAVPVGAGPYKATTRTGDSSKVTGATFKENNVVYFERNEHFMRPVKIKYVNYQVVAEKQMLDSLFNGAVHFAEPACKQENVDLIGSRKGFEGNYVQTNGYGYIGINAEKVPDILVRRAIMHAINTQLCVDYYFGYASAIYRPMTRASWAYPKSTDASGQYYEFDETGKTSEDLVKKAGYTLNSKTGVYEKKVSQQETRTLEYTFTIAGDSEDHPAFKAMQIAATILNAHGFKIKVQKDINALKKLNTGDLTVWAAAWGSGIDPDMYQVYHIDSLAGSTANWGYRAIRRNSGNKYDKELEIVTALSKIIDEARQNSDITFRTQKYADALELIMQLAVELPTYQRSDLFAYNAKYIDADTLVHGDELTPFNGPLSRIWEVSFVNQK